MRVPILTAASVLLPMTAAMANDITLTSAIKQVTVFPAGAEISRTAPFEMEAGDHILVIRDLPERLIDQSLRIEGRGDGAFQIGAVDSKKIYVNVAPADGELDDTEREKLEKEIERLSDERDLVDGRIRAAELQRRLMEQLAGLPDVRPSPDGQGVTSYSVENWGNLYDLIGARSIAADDLIHKFQIQRRDITKEIEKLQKRLSQQPPKKERQTEVRVAVNAGVALKGELHIKYQVNEAVWRPFYDARLETGSADKAPALQLERRAGIRQWSGEDWQNVKLSLSTTSPQKGAEAPVLPPEQLDLLEPKPPARPMAKMSRDRFMAGERSLAREDAESVMAAPAPESILAGDVEADVHQYTFQAVFDIPGVISVPASGDEKKVAINTEEYQPKLSVQTVPKLNDSAFLYAEFTHNSGATPLLPGSVALYRDGTFTGNGHLPLVNAGDKHALGFGVDDAVKVTRTEVKRQKGETGLLTTSKLDERRYNIKVVNLHQTPVDVAVIDQIPYSVNEKVVVTMLPTTTKPSRQNVEDRRGILAWDFTLEPGKEKLINLDYSISWPADRELESQ